MTSKSILLLAASAGLAMAASQPASAALIDVQFAGANAQSGAALVGTAGDTWNLFGQAPAGTFQGPQNNPSASLVTSDNKLSSYSLSYYSPFAYTANVNFDQFTGTPYANLMQGYLYTFKSANSDIHAQISGLNPGQAFSLYVYTQGDDYTAGRVNSLTVNGVPQTNVNTNANTFIPNDNYALFQGVASSTGTIRIVDYVTNTEANLNGFQLLTASVPEPSTWAMLLTGFGALGGAMRTARRKQAATG